MDGLQVCTDLALAPGPDHDRPPHLRNAAAPLCLLCGRASYQQQCKVLCTLHFLCNLTHDLRRECPARGACHFIHATVPATAALIKIRVFTRRGGMFVPQKYGTEPVQVRSEGGAVLGRLCSVNWSDHVLVVLPVEHKFSGGTWTILCTNQTPFNVDAKTDMWRFASEMTSLTHFLAATKNDERLKPVPRKRPRWIVHRPLSSASS